MSLPFSERPTPPDAPLVPRPKDSPKPNILDERPPELGPEPTTGAGYATRGYIRHRDRITLWKAAALALISVLATAYTTWMNVQANPRIVYIEQTTETRPAPDAGW